MVQSTGTCQSGYCEATRDLAARDGSPSAGHAAGS
ncbi:MAG TPA: hypothetical protein DEB46_05800 [Myxococcales bacterium]|nr:hypothetical protein [Myxococcales bacterium]